MNRMKSLDKKVQINVEVKTPELDAQLIVENIVAQLEKRNFRRAMKQSHVTGHEIRCQRYKNSL